MAKLVISDAEGGTREYPLTKERVSIGRHPDNDISLNDKAVSGKHAVVITILHDSFLEDLNSTNGTLVNGKQIAKHPLSDGDTIGIGRNTIKYHSEAAAGAEDDFEKTMILRPGQMGAAFESQVNKAAASAPGADHPAGKPLLAKLRVVSGGNAGKELELNKPFTTIGRPGVQVAAITRRADGFYIVNVGGNSSGSRPRVNGAEIDVQARKLNNGDTVELVGTKMMFTLSG
ncbi:MAG: FHA domain-containing protein [Nevskia sp.]|nr:FHA domain-containing protein [Nevskia sp.]